MKRIIALLLILVMVVTACSSQGEPDVETEIPVETAPPVITIPNTSVPKTIIEIDDIPDFEGLNDPAFLRYIEDIVYSDIISELDSDSFFVENISAIYQSKEYLDELAFNSQENIYFGYTLSELDAQFQGTKYIFTLGENDQTIARAFEKYDDTFDKIIKNVAIGTGVILICVTVSVATGGATPAVSFIFAASAKTATTFALSSAVISGTVAAVVTGVETNDVDASLKAAALAASDGFKWGAITGSFFGGAQSAVALKGATLNGLTMNQAAVIQRETKLPLDVIKQFHTVDEARAFTELRTIMLDGKAVLVPKEFDLNFIDDFGRTNLQRMEQGLNALDPKTGFSYEWHHIGGKADGTLAMLTREQHDIPALHRMIQNSEIDRAAFNIERQALDKALARLLGGN